MNSEKIHEWFSLSYSNYLVLPRSLMQEMPDEWQEKMVALLREMEDTFDYSANYWIRARRGNRFVEDPFAQYRRPDMQAINAARKITVQKFPGDGGLG